MNEQGFQDLKKDVSIIKDAILGAGLHKDNGILDRQKRIEKKVNEHERILWMMGGVMFIISVIIGILKLFDTINISI